MPPPAKYVYCIIPCGEERTFDVKGIGEADSVVHTVDCQGLAVVASDTSKVRFESTRSNMMAHEKVLERVMGEFTLLPVRFGTVADGGSPTTNIQKLLCRRFQEFSQLLRDLEGKAELGLKAFWRDQGAVFQEIVAEDQQIKALRHQLSGKPPEIVRFQGVALGRMVKEALERKRRQESGRLLTPLRPLAEQVRENHCLADRMVLNTAFLIDRRRGAEFDRAVEGLDQEYGSRVGFKYIGPTPPYNFVDIVVNWEEPEE